MSSNPRRKQKDDCPYCIRLGRVCDGLVPECMYYRRSAPLNPTRPRQIRNKEEEMYLEEHIRELEQKLDTLSSSSSTPKASPRFSSRSASTSPRSPEVVPNVFRNCPPEMTGEWWRPATLRSSVRDYLVHIFLAYAGQHHIQVDGSGLLRALRSVNPAEQPHPALLDSIYLFACSCTDSLAQSSPLSLVGLEEHFLLRARKDMNDSLAFADRLLDYLKASTIIAAYLLRRGRHLEGYHHLSGAARLAMACGLHRIASPIFPPHIPEAASTSPEGVILLRPPSNRMEVADRIITFWNTYAQDQLYSIVHGFTPALDESLEDIRTPLPRPLVEYEQNDIRLQDIDYAYRMFRESSGSPTRSLQRAESGFASFIKALILLRNVRVTLASRSGGASRLVPLLQAFNRSLSHAAEIASDGTTITDRFLFSALVCAQTGTLQLSAASGTSSMVEQLNIAMSLADSLRSPYQQQLARSSPLVQSCLPYAQSVLEECERLALRGRPVGNVDREDVRERISVITRVTSLD